MRVATGDILKCFVLGSVSSDVQLFNFGALSAEEISPAPVSPAIVIVIVVVVYGVRFAVLGRHSTIRVNQMLSGTTTASSVWRSQSLVRVLTVLVGNPQRKTMARSTTAIHPHAETMFYKESLVTEHD